MRERARHAQAWPAGRTVLLFALGFSGAIVVQRGLDWSMRLRGGATGVAPPATCAAIEPSSVKDPHVDDLRRRNLLVPVQGINAKNLIDTFDAPRDKTRHEAIDILAPRGTPVLAVEHGTIEKLFTSAQGGLTIYEFDPSRTYAYYYAHLDGYAEGLHEHNRVERGAVLGYVGTTGNAPKNTPHLHFSVFLLTPETQWWMGTAIDPFLIWRD
jgi:murein DD-endopeptidase MepM/ murein hydrolase activator NlpD